MGRWGWVACLLGVIAPLGAVREAAAQSDPPYTPPAAPFGSRGQWVATNAWVASVSSTSFDGSDASSFTATLSGGVDYFVVRNLSIGLNFGTSYSNVSGYTPDGSLVKTETSELSLGPRVGYNVSLSKRFSFYPRASFGVEASHSDEVLLSGSPYAINGSTIGVRATTQTGPWISLYAPVLYHPTSHFFLGFGPYAFRDFSDNQDSAYLGAERTTLGGQLEIGGAFGGEPPASTEDLPRAPPSSRRRFGEQGEVVLMGSVSASGLWTGYDGTSSASTFISVSPTYDYFVLNHLAIGLTASYSYSNVSGLAGSERATLKTSTLSIAPDVAVDIPLGEWLSLYPTASIVFGHGWQDETSTIGQNDSTNTVVSVSLWVPLLLHVAPHLFVGFGPNVSHDLSNAYGSVDGTYIENRATTFGAGLVVGGWL